MRQSKTDLLRRIFGDKITAFSSNNKAAFNGFDGIRSNQLVIGFCDSLKVGRDISGLRGSNMLKKNGLT